MADGDFSDHSDTYEESLGKSHKYFLRVKSEELLAVMNSHFGLGSSGIKCLDLGCGTGEIEEILPDLDTLGVDVTRGMLLQTMSKELDGSFIQASACALPLKDSTFDVIFTMSMVHHISGDEDRDCLFTETSRVLKRGGLLVIFEHNPHNPVTRLIVSRCPLDRNARLISAGEVRGYYQKHGIRHLATRYITFFPKLLSMLRPIEQAIAFIPLGGQYYILGKVEK